MSGGNGIHRLGDKHFCTIERAEELVHATYLVCLREGLEREQKMAKAFEERIKGLEAQIATLTQNAAIAD